MIVLVSGGRDYENWKRIHETLDVFHGRYGISRLVHGGAKGADFHAANWAKKNRVEESGDAWLPDWDAYGRAAGILRNEAMLFGERPDLVIIFEGGRGTTHMRRIAVENEFPVLHVPDPKWKPLDIEAAWAASEDVLDDVLAIELPPWEEEEVSTKPQWLSPPRKRWAPKVVLPPTPTGRYDSVF